MDRPDWASVDRIPTDGSSGRSVAPVTPIGVTMVLIGTECAVEHNYG